MKAEIVNVTPQMAADWLSLNEDNRPLRRTVVDGLKAAFGRGEYLQTHQGIAFSKTGKLLDGQHRLTAISELRDGLFPMLVSWGVAENAFQVMDIGVKRSPADALRIADRRVVEVARLIGVICMVKRANVTPTMLMPIIQHIQVAHDSLMAFCPTSVRSWSAAPVRLAAVSSILNGTSQDYVKAVYRALVLSDFDHMPPIAHSLYRAHVNGSVRASDTYDMLARCLDVFNPKKGGNKKIQIKDNSEAVAHIKSLFGHLIEQEAPMAKKMATQEWAAKGVLQRNSNRIASI